jgi:hypothetical protein
VRLEASASAAPPPIAGCFIAMRPAGPADATQTAMGHDLDFGRNLSGNHGTCLIPRTATTGADIGLSSTTTRFGRDGRCGARERVDPERNLLQADQRLNLRSTHAHINILDCIRPRDAAIVFELQKNELKLLKSLRRAQNRTPHPDVQFLSAATARERRPSRQVKASSDESASQPSRCKAARASLLLGLIVTARW